MSEEHDQTLELRRINNLLEKRLSTPRIFFLGIVSGLGSAIGATIVAGIVLTIAFWFFKEIDREDLYERFLNPASTMQERAPTPSY